MKVSIKYIIECLNAFFIILRVVDHLDKKLSNLTNLNGDKSNVISLLFLKIIEIKIIASNN